MNVLMFMVKLHVASMRSARICQEATSVNVPLDSTEIHILYARNVTPQNVNVNRRINLSVGIAFWQAVQTEKSVQPVQNVFRSQEESATVRVRRDIERNWTDLA